MDIKQLRDQWTATIGKAKAIRDAANGRDLNDDEANAITALMEEANGQREKINAADKRARALSDLSDHEAHAGRPEPRIVRTADPALADAIEQRRLGNMRPWERLRAGGKTIAFRAIPEMGITSAMARKNAYDTGMWLAALYGSHKASAYCRENGIGMNRWNDSGEPEIGAVMGGTNMSGEYFVPEVMAAAIIDLREQFGVARQLASIQPMTSDTLVINKRVGGLTAYPVGRVLTATVTASDLSWGQIELHARTWAALSLVARDLMDDAVISVADQVVSEMAYAFATTEDDCYFNGDGTSTYHNIYGIRPKLIEGLGGASERVGAFDAASGHDTFAELTTADLAGLMATLPAFALPRARFVCSSVAYALTFQAIMQSAGGNTVNDLAGPTRYSYAGFPITIAQKMPTATTDISDTAMILFGDFEMGSVIGDRMGFSAQVLNERYAELRQVGVIGATRFDINIFGLGDATNAGAIVGLIGE